jgi:uncharacterized protein (DUF488 family)
MPSTLSKCFTVGYGGRTLDDFVSLLQRAGVDRIVDVRALPLSRKKGFSKTPLSAALAEGGIEYMHLRNAGNPYRDQKQDVERCLALYAGYLDSKPEIVVEVEAALRGRKAALLCAEAEHEHCHRSIIADRLQAHDRKRRVEHL